MKTNIKYILSICILITLVACQKNESLDQSLTAGGKASEFIYTPDNSNSLLIKFTAANAGSGSLYSWNFGDGKYDTVQNPMHLYNSTGNFNAKLTVTNKAGIFTSEKTVLVSSASFTLITNDATDALKVSVTNTSINCTNYKWEWGDATQTLGENPGSHNYANAGIYTVKLSANLANSTINTSSEIKVFVASKADFAGTTSRTWKYHTTQGLSFFGSFSNQLGCELATEFNFFANNNYFCDNKGSEIVYPSCTPKPARPVTQWSYTRINLLKFRLNIGVEGLTFLGDPVTGPNYTLVNLTPTLMEFDEVAFGFTNQVKYKFLKQ